MEYTLLPKYYIVIAHYNGISKLSKYIKLRAAFRTGKSGITHTAALSKDLRIVYEAWGGGCTNDPWWNSHHTPGTVVEVFYIPCTKEQEESFYAHLETTKGMEYDYLGVLLGFLTHKEIQDRTKLFCTERIELALEAAGLCFQARIPAHKQYPALAYISPIQKPLTILKTP